ncbi:MAG: hypothetical protein K940chlam6_01128 [Chlamydiae bacterium]|nr:hypothetical protein [Chlamydiota bacterium]
MKIWVFVFLAFLSACSQENEKTVLFSILARNKAHVLPRYLKCIEKIDYDKKAITLYINTNNNEDATEEILKEWVAANREKYREIIFDSHTIEDLQRTNPHEWTVQRFKTLGAIRNKSMQIAQEKECNYYFVVDCDNFIAPSTLKTLMSKDKPIVAPMLWAIPENQDPYSNFFCAITENGYYKEHPEYWLILHRIQEGTYKVPVVHCTYLIQSQYLDQLSYIDDSNDYEFIVFSRMAREKGIDQYICNEENFGVLVHFYKDLDLSQEESIMKPFLAMP